jgi:hypothetical protein
MKPWFKSKEVWVLGLAVFIGAAKFFGMELEGLMRDATDVYIKFSPFIALLLRLFWTKEPLTTTLNKNA